MKKDLMPGPEAAKLLVDAASQNYAVASTATENLAKAFEAPIRQAVVNGDILDNIFNVETIAPGKVWEVPTDIVTQGNLKNHKAYTVPRSGGPANRLVESDYIQVNTFDVTNSIDCKKRLLNVGSWDIMKRLLEVLAGGFTDKMNDDGFRLLVKAAYDRNLMTIDSAAPQGYLTKKLVTTTKTSMRRNGGGNSTSRMSRALTDIYMSYEALDDIYNWDLSQIPDQVRTQIFLDENGVSKIYGVNLHGLAEFGVGQPYQNYYVNELGGTFSSGKEELMLGLSLNRRDSFVWIQEGELEVFEDPNYHRQRMVSFYAFASYGLACLDSRAVIGLQI